MADRSYRIEPAGCGFTVTIEPPVIGIEPSRSFDCHKQARGWASAMRLAYPGKIVDLAAAPAKGGAHG